MKSLRILLPISMLYLMFLYSCTDPFSNVVVTESEVGPYNLVMTEYFGDYSQTFSLRDTVVSGLLVKGIIAEKYFGIFYTNPLENSITAQHHSIVGCLLPDSDSLRSRELIRRGYRIEKVGATRSLVAKFPYSASFPVIEGVSKMFEVFTLYAEQKKYKPTAVFVTYGKDEIVYSMEIIE